MLKTFKVPIIGGKDCQSVTRTPANGEVFKIGDRISVTALYTPCHTQDSICYFMQDGNDKAVFTGDTLLNSLVMQDGNDKAVFTGDTLFIGGMPS